MEKVRKGLHKVYNNARESECISVYGTGYMYLPAFVRRQIEDRFGYGTVDIYFSDNKPMDEDQIYLIPKQNGDYTLSGSGSGYRVCVYTLLDHVIEPGRHYFAIDDEEDEMVIKIDCSACKSAKGA